MISRATALFLALTLLSCGSSTPAPPSIDTFLPALPPTGGAAVSQAGLVTDANRAARVPAGDAAKGLPGDHYLQNDKIRLLIQAPGRVGELLGYGGSGRPAAPSPR